MRKASLSFIIAIGLATQGCATTAAPPPGHPSNSNSHTQKKCSRSSGSFPNLSGMNFGSGNDGGATVLLIGLLVVLVVVAIAAAPLTDSSDTCY